MIQFNIKRFGHLVTWTFAQEKRQYLRLMFSWAAVFSIVFATQVLNITPVKSAYVSLVAISVVAIVILFEIGPSTLFSTMKEKNDMQTLLLLPASNFEKYLLRYSQWILQMALLIGSLLIADGVQYVAQLIAGHSDVQFFMPMIFSSLPAFDGSLFLIFILLLYGHSFYAVGGTFFRSRKFAWIFTSIVNSLLGCLLLFILISIAGDRQMNLLVKDILNEPLTYVIAFLLTVFNFWLSYRLFCRMQLKGRFVNI